jgi:NADH-ubiquinone oxidoreductase chain 6
MTTTIIINLLSIGILFSSIISITNNNPIISIVFLISTFVHAAAYLILIGVNFFGISYIVVYVGAIAVLFLFIILMINIKYNEIVETGKSYNKNLPLGFIISTFFLFIFNAIAITTFNNIPLLALEFFNYSTNYFNVKDNVNFIINMSSNPIISKYDDNLLDGFNNYQLLDIGKKMDSIIMEYPQIEALGHSLYTYGGILLIILSLVLLLAMVAIIVISKDNKNI